MNLISRMCASVKVQQRILPTFSDFVLLFVACLFLYIYKTFFKVFLFFSHFYILTVFFISKLFIGNNISTDTSGK